MRKSELIAALQGAAKSEQPPAEKRSEASAPEQSEVQQPAAAQPQAEGEPQKAGREESRDGGRNRNRNREQMLTYLDLVDRAAPELRTMINPMTDKVSKEHPEGFYTIFAEKFDIVMPHFWARSSNIIARTRHPGGAELWSYNDGPNRVGWGLHSWANRLHGRMQYAWLLNGPLDHPYAPVQLGSFEYAGHHPGMHLWATDLDGTLLPTPRLLGVREGIDDYRYVYTLEQAVATAPASDIKREAQAWLDKLRTEVPAYAHADDFVDETLAGDSEAEFSFTASLDRNRFKAADYVNRFSGIDKARHPHK